MITTRTVLSGALALGTATSAACGDARPTQARALSDVTLGLSSRLGAQEYRLASARFTLSGAAAREFEVADEERYHLALPAGAYRLELQRGWVLARREGDRLTPVEATLLSDNPMTFEVQSGETSLLRLRFGVPGGRSVTTGPGQLELSLDVEQDAGADADGGSLRECEGGVVINEVDYAQPGPDDLEMVELLNAGSCPAPLAELSLEAVNGQDGRTYARYPLGRAAQQLAPGARLVLGDQAVLDRLPRDVPRQPLVSTGLQNGPDALRLWAGGVLLDAVAYGGPGAPAGEGQPAPADPGEGSLGRCDGGLDSQDNASDFSPQPASPGLPNNC